MTYVVVAHAGTGSRPEETDGTDKAVRRGMDVLQEGGSVLDAVCATLVLLEDDPRFNAGTGSNLRFDGKTIEMDAAIMHSDGRFGAVSAIREVKNPILVARDVFATPHKILSGTGALRYARAMGHRSHNPWTPRAHRKFEEIIGSIRTCKYSRSDCEWDLEPLERQWNYEVPYEAVIGVPEQGGDRARVGVGDTIGAVVTDGRHYAAGASTGGTITTLFGRVGDTPSFGCGIYAGEHGAVACTGNGDHITGKLLAYRVHEWLGEGMHPKEAPEKVCALFPAWVDCNVIVLGGDAYAAGGNREMAWSALKED